MKTRFRSQAIVTTSHSLVARYLLVPETIDAGDILLDQPLRT